MRIMMVMPCIRSETLQTPNPSRSTLNPEPYRFRGIVLPDPDEATCMNFDRIIIVSFHKGRLTPLA